MSSDRRGLRGVVVVEDQRTQRFLMRLLAHLGFTGRFEYQIAPAGQGAAERWVLLRAIEEIAAQRARAHQRLSVVVVRDGDNVGVAVRMEEVDQALVAAGQAKRSIHERIALPVPTWSVETWLLHLLGEQQVDQNQRPPAGGAMWKQHYEHQFGAFEGQAAKQAAAKWPKSPTGLPSLDQAVIELGRLDL